MQVDASGNAFKLEDAIKLCKAWRDEPVKEERMHEVFAQGFLCLDGLYGLKGSGETRMQDESRSNSDSEVSEKSRHCGQNVACFEVVGRVLTPALRRSSKKSRRRMSFPGQGSLLASR